ncbi:MAG: D-alanine--poly(phosphoribitol) ligase, partial [Clostridia bacterium]|nr:D-alanine--poly(phosphoribitol) ligase [Clostridia bacterium]
DLGRYDENGDLVFCGRTDNQIKYLGHRIELEEIERNIYQIDGVDRCFCAFENEKLKGYYVGQIDKTALHTHLRATLPPFMVPGFLRRLDEMPMTKNGKIDRKAAIAIAEGGNEDGR